MKYLLLFLLSIPVMASAQTVTIDPDGTMKVKCPSCPVCPICPPPVIKRDTIYLLVYRDTVIYRDTCTSVPVPNKPPSANAGSDKSITLPTTVTSTQGSGTDPDGTIAGYSWTKVSGPTATINNQFTSTPTFTLSTAGQYIFRLAVTDNKGLSASDDITITLNPGSTTPGQIFNFTPAQIASSVELSPRPGRGAEWWNNEYKYNEAGTAIDGYARYKASQFETSKGVYDFSRLYNDIKRVADRGGLFGCGWMTLFPGNRDDGSYLIDGGYACYPAYVHQQMQAESVKDWKTNGASSNTGPTTGTGYWVPNYNSPSYLNWLSSFYRAINNYLNTTEYKGRKLKQYIQYIDIRGYGSTGEWHHAYAVTTMDQFPAGTRATDATLKRIIEIHDEEFPDVPLVFIENALDCNQFNNTKNSPQTAYNVLTMRNKWGLHGLRRDHWGDKSTYYSGITYRNTTVINGLRIDTAVINRHKYAPVVGEPCCAGGDYSDLENQVRQLHAMSFGNSNYDGGANPSHVSAASRASGYRLTITSGSVTTGNNLTIVTNWSNLGVAPTYENWQVVYTIGSWTGTSSFNPKLFTGTKTVTDVFAMPSLPAGSYPVRIRISDPSGYRPNIPMAIQSDILTTITIN